ncbi:hypothetical protein [Sphingobacterium chungjuense]|uniref:hypothetical protein n=1 Tax=Sphingobacterium chungjuense TaxID=2675553 RepID=UPI00140DCFF7|nr:hypothetical protein [Sphingobacterium chungjuense]
MKVQDIQDLFNDVTTSIRRLENRIRDDHQTPVSNINPDSYEKIRIPYNYVRRKAEFIQNYSLSSFVGKNRVLFNNIAYSLQLTDFNNFILNRIEIYGAIKNQFLKNCITHNFAIVEAVIMEVLYDLGTHCKIDNLTCRHNSHCSGFINCNQNMKHPLAKDLLANKIKVSVEFLTVYSIILKIRDRVHMRLVEANEYFDNDNVLTLKMYNESIRLLRYIKSDFLDDISRFLELRESVCTK